MATTEKKSPEIVKKVSTKQVRPNVVKKSPEEEIYRIFKDTFNKNSPLMQQLQNHGLIVAIKDNSEILKKQQDLFHHNIIIGKQLTTALIKNSSKLDFVVQAFEKNNKENKSKKDIKVENVLKSSSQTIKELTKNVKSVFDFLKQAEVKKQEQEIQQDVEKFKAKLESKKQLDNQKKLKESQENVWFSRPTYQPTQLEKKSTQLFEKGFHYINGSINEYLQKKRFKNKGFEKEQNLSEDEQSPQQHSYNKTKNQWRGFKEEVKQTYKNTKDNIDNVKNQWKGFKDNVKQTYKDTKDNNIIKSGNIKIVSSINRVHSVLQTIAKYFTDKVEHNKEKEDENALKIQPRQRDSLGRFVKKQTIETVPTTEKSPSFIKTAKNAITNKLLTKGKSLFGKIFSRGAGAAGSIEGSAAAGGEAATGATASGAGLAALAVPAAIVAASAAATYFGYKDVKEFNKYRTESKNAKESGKQYENKLETFKEKDPKRYEAMQLEQNIGELQRKPKTPETEKQINNLQEKLKNVKKEINIEESNKQPIKNTENIEPNKNVNTPPILEKKINNTPLISNPKESTPIISHTDPNLVEELKNGRIVEILENILKNISNLHQGDSQKNIFGTPKDLPNMSKSTIFQQRENFRSSF